MARPIPTNSGESASPISAPRNSLAAMLAAGMTVEDIRNQAPESHRQMDRRLGIRSEQEVKNLVSLALDQPLPSAHKGESKAIATNWRRGDRAVDTKHQKIVTILAAREKVTEDGIPLHRVAAGGRSWLLRETKLKPILRK